MPDPRLHSALAGDCGSFGSSLLASAMHLRPLRGWWTECSLASPGSSVSSTWTIYWHVGGSFKTALASLCQVLERVAAAGLKLHPDKCHFLRREVTFLGHKVGGEGISTMEDKVQAIQDWPTPTDTRQLKSFLGLASYYRRFVRGFSCVAASLFRLLQKNREFV